MSKTGPAGFRSRWMAAVSSGIIIGTLRVEVVFLFCTLRWYLLSALSTTAPCTRINLGFAGMSSHRRAWISEIRKEERANSAGTA